MPPRARTTVLTLWLVLFAAVFLLCKIPQPPEWPKYPSAFAAWITFPITLTGLSDLRFYAMPFGASILLLILALQPVSNRLPRASGLPRAYWFEICAAFCVMLACLSATFNKSWDVSGGWILGLIASLAWTALLPRLIDLRALPAALFGGGLIAVGGAVAAIGHRQIMGERFFDMPIGPVTLTAAFAAIWIVMSLSWSATRILLRDGSLARLALPILLSLSVAVGGFGLLALADRRGAWFGLAVGLVYAFFLLTSTKLRRPVQRIALTGATLATCCTAAALYLSKVSVSTIIPDSSLSYRFVYWRKMAEALPDVWLMGSGPDTFLFKMTSMMARQRAEMPRVYQGNIDMDAHNEWLHAAFEMGIPAGMVYLAIPVIILVLVTRAFNRSTDTPRRAMLLAIGAGILTIMIVECSSVNLRQPMLATWFYSLLGLALVAARHDRMPTKPQSTPAKRHPAWRIAQATVALAILVGVVVDVRSGMAHARAKQIVESDPRQAEQYLMTATHRLRAIRWLTANFELALAQMMQLRLAHPAGTPTPPIIGPDGKPTEFHDLAERTLSTWRKIASKSIEYSGTAFGLTEALMLAGQYEEACRQLRWNIDHINPYDKRSNALLAALCPLDTMEQLECIRRALRETSWDSVMQNRSAICFAEQGVIATWQPLVASARECVARPVTDQWSDPLAPETLRVEAARLVADGKIADAAMVQLVAADAYEKLRLEGSPYRRPAAVEADALLRAAQFVFYADPLKYPQACELVSKAEEMAVLGVLSEPVAGASASAEFVGGQVVPVDRPDWSLSIWRFAAMMRLANMKSPDSIMQRINWSLPPSHRTQTALQSELGRMCGELVDVFNPIPESQRPPGFARLVELARQHREQAPPR